MSLNSVPAAERIHIGFYGKRNAGKSSLVNAVTSQSLAIVSDVPGTTTDPVTGDPITTYGVKEGTYVAAIVNNGHVHVKSAVTAASDAEICPTVLEGSEDPIGGWVSYGYSLRVPCPQLTLRRQGKAPFRCVTVIAPKGCKATVTFVQDAAVVELNGIYHTRLTLRGDETERK